MSLARKKFTEFKSVTYKNQHGTATVYGLAADRIGNGWWLLMSQDLVDYSDLKTGKSGELKLPAHEENAVGVGDIQHMGAFNPGIRVRRGDTLAVDGVNIVALAEAQRMQQRLAPLHGVGLRKAGLAGRLIVEVERLAGQQDNVLELGPAVFHQISPQRGQPHTGYCGNAQHGKADHHQELVGDPEIAEH